MSHLERDITAKRSPPVINASSSNNNFLCAECGEFVGKLHSRTGWCLTCTALIKNNDPNCTECGREKDHVGNKGKLECTYCNLEGWLADNADHLEHYMTKGHSLSKAIDLLRLEVRPHCASCGAVMGRTRRNAVFCHRTERCRKAVRKYKYLIYDKNLPPSHALAVVLEQLNGS